MAAQLQITGTIPSLVGVETVGPVGVTGGAVPVTKLNVATGAGGDTAVVPPAGTKAMLVEPAGFSTTSPPTLNVRLTGQGAGTAIPLSVFNPTLISFDTAPAGLTFNLSGAGPATAVIGVTLL